MSRLTKGYSGLLINRFDETDYIYCIHGNSLWYYRDGSLIKSCLSVTDKMNRGGYKILKGKELNKYLMISELLK